MDYSRTWFDDHQTPLLKDVAFNKHSMNEDGAHNSPFDNGRVDIGTDNIVVRLTQDFDEEQFKNTLRTATLATTGISPDQELDVPWEEMLRGGLQQSLEAAIVVFNVWGLDRTLTHQLVRTRKASFLQQSQRATFMGTYPDMRMPESIWLNPVARAAWIRAADHAKMAYRTICEEDISYQDARSVLLESTETFIQCQYSIREFMNMYSYRGCSMFQWQHFHVVREMRRLLIEAHPWLDPYVKISCQTGEPCPDCDGHAATGNDEELCSTCGGGGKVGTGRCSYQGWENVEGQCPFPQAKQENRTFLPDSKLRIGKKT